MTKFQNVNEFLSTAKGVEGSLLIPKKIHDALVEETMKSLIPRSEAGWYMGPSAIPGSSVDLDIETPDSVAVRSIAEGAEIFADSSDYTSINLKPVKYGTQLRITKEMLEDGKWNLLQRNVKLVGKRLAENENSFVITALDQRANTVSGGAAITIANITRAMQHLEDADYNPTTFVIGMEVLNDLRNIDTFVEVNKVGNRDMLGKGFLGSLYGMKVYKVSSNAGMAATSSYVFDNDFAYAVAEKRPITVENFSLPLLDSRGSCVTQRLRVRQVRTSAIAKITTS